jgi:hypothetical protein
MLAGTHALLPVCTCLLVENTSLACGRGRLFPPKTMLLVAAFGVLPDLCTPHISLEARYTSWSHTLWFMIGMLFVCAMASSFIEKGYRLRVAVVCWLAAALHLVADAVSGGIAWLYPWRDVVVGSYIIPPQHWIWFDAGFILLTWFLVRVLPHLEARGIRKANTTENP